jgi:hypothetical protein
VSPSDPADQRSPLLALGSGLRRLSQDLGATVRPRHWPRPIPDSQFVSAYSTAFSAAPHCELGVLVLAAILMLVLQQRRRHVKLNGGE